MAHDDQAIRELAYRLWQEDGGAQGSPQHYWWAAERQLRGDAGSPTQPADAIEESLEESFPASDPPASHLPDEPPANAQAKFKAAGRRPR